MLIINFKTYKFGKDVLKLAKQLEKIDKNIVVALQPTDIHFVSQNTKLKILSQHTDSFESGKNTGFILPEAIKSAGAGGTLINHSEHRVSFDEIKKTVQRCKALHLQTIICVARLSEAEKVKRLKPYAIAYEDPALISSGKSIVEYDSGKIKDFVKLLKRTKIVPICGAGISSISDYIEAKKLGCKGVLVASAAANVKNPAGFFKI